MKLNDQNLSMWISVNLYQVQGVPSRATCENLEPSKWLILVNKTTELLSSYHRPPANQQNGHFQWVLNCKMIFLGLDYENSRDLLHRIYSFFLMFQLRVTIFNDVWNLSEMRNFWSCFDVLITSISHFEISKVFYCNVFVGHLMWYIEITCKVTHDETLCVKVFHLPKLPIFATKRPRDFLNYLSHLPIMRNGDTCFKHQREMI